MSVRVNVNSFDELYSLIRLAGTLQDRAMEISSDPRFEHRMALTALREEVMREFNQAISQLDAERAERDRRNRAPTPEPRQEYASEPDEEEQEQQQRLPDPDAETPGGRRMRSRTDNYGPSGGSTGYSAPSVLF